MSGDNTHGLWLEYVRTRDQKLRDRLILTYAPLVKYVAGRLGSGLPAHVDEGDLVSYGLLGLIGAIERYKPELEIKFETYALARIKVETSLESAAGAGLVIEALPEDLALKAETFGQLGEVCNPGAILATARRMTMAVNTICNRRAWPAMR